MVPSERLKAASELVEWLRQAVHEQPLLASNRSRASAGCFGVAQEHHHAIVLLAHHRLYAPSFSLLRVEFEAYVRGVWLSLDACASDSEVEGFLTGDEPPRISDLLAAMTTHLAFRRRRCFPASNVKVGRQCARTRTQAACTSNVGIQARQSSRPTRPAKSRRSCGSRSLSPLCLLLV